ncbi:hypothetical protein ACW7BJ_20930 [Azospirillum argentinense]
MRAAAKTFAEGFRDGDLQRVADALQVVEAECAWKAAFAACSRLPSVHPEARERFLEIWCRLGDSLRLEVGDDQVLLAGLRVLLPPYTGPGLTLYRGDTMWARRRRSYGPSWSSDAVVAESHARNRAHLRGGAVVLKTDAPPEAIICAPALLTDSFNEAEYIVDRRRLRAVTVLRRYPQIRPAERLERPETAFIPPA